MNEYALMAKAQRALTSALSLHLVKPGLFPVALGKSFNKAEDLRLIADYKGDPLEADDARWVVAQAGEFVARIHTQFFQKGLE